MTLEQFTNQIQNTPENVEFSDVISLFGELYSYTPTTFFNGTGEDETKNDAGTNEGSCKIFAFAKDIGLNEQQTLQCFGHYYRDDVLKNPEGSDHANIRNFMKYGWAGIRFEGNALSPLS